MMNVTPDQTEVLQAGPVRKFKRSEFDQMVREGWFQDERVELLLGTLFEMAPIDPAHCVSADLLRRVFERGIGDRAFIMSGNPFAASEDSEPQPDLTIVPNGDYWKEHPSRALLVIEVSRTSLKYDRGLKSLVYCTAKVDEYWIVNHVDRCVEIHRESGPDGWQIKLRAYPGETIAPLAFPDVTIEVSAILPP